MVITVSIRPKNLINSVHDLIRLAFPDYELITDKTKRADISLEVNCSYVGNNAIFNGIVQSEKGETKFKEAYALKMPDKEREKEVKRLARIFVYKLLCLYMERNINPYGILTGVRPVKIIHRLLDRAYNTEEIIKHVRQEYLIDEQKAKLLSTIASNNRAYLPLHKENQKKISIYIGIPYCPSRCYYCSFPGAVLKNYEQDIPPFLEALYREIHALADCITEKGLEVESIYLGGGTPTVLNEKDLEKILALVSEKYISKATKEITVEAGRPDTISSTKVKIMKDARVNRICINPQTMNDFTLKKIGRNHNQDDVIRAVAECRSAGIEKINMDLIVGLAGEGIRENEYSLERILELRPENITIHSLAVKKGSVIDELEGKSFLSEKMDELEHVIDLYSERLADKNYIPYYLYRQKYIVANMENKGYALPGEFCLYNIQMMEERQTIIGMGGGASSKFVNVNDWSLSSIHNPKNPWQYCNTVDKLISRKVDKLTGLN